MATIGSDGLSLWVGDGAATEVFTVLKGLAVSQLEINQRSYIANAIATDAWQVQVGTANRQVVLECESYATDESAALRLKRWRCLVMPEISSLSCGALKRCR